MNKYHPSGGTGFPEWSSLKKWWNSHEHCAHAIEVVSGKKRIYTGKHYTRVRCWKVTYKCCICGEEIERYYTGDHISTYQKRKYMEDWSKWADWILWRNPILDIIWVERKKGITRVKTTMYTVPRDDGKTDWPKPRK